MRYAVNGRPVARLVLELCEDREALPADQHLLSFEEWLNWDSALAPSVARVESATARLREIAEEIGADLAVLYRCVPLRPLRVLREGDIENFRPMLAHVRVERLDTWRDERYEVDQAGGV